MAYLSKSPGCAYACLSTYKSAEFYGSSFCFCFFTVLNIAGIRFLTQNREMIQCLRCQIYLHGSLTQNICHLSAFWLSFYSWTTQIFSSAFCKCGKKWFRFIKQRKGFPKWFCLDKRAVRKRWAMLKTDATGFKNAIIKGFYPWASRKCWSFLPFTVF